VLVREQEHPVHRPCNPAQALAYLLLRWTAATHS
jgi:hypothetical protein